MVFARLPSAIPPAGPTRMLATATLVKTIGDGLFVTVSVLFFTKVAGLDLIEVGIGLTIAGLAGTLAGVPLGHLADRDSPRRVLLVLMTALGPAVLCYLAARSFTAFTAVACVVLVLQRGCGAVLAALVADLTEATGRVAVRAQLQVVTNAGIAVGAGTAGIALYLDSVPAYRALVVAAALAYATAAATLTRIPPPARTGGRRRERPTLVLRDYPYLVFTILNAVLSLNSGLLQIAVPLWLVRHTEAPTWVLSALIVLNTLVVVAFQMKVSSRGTSIRGWARSSRFAGLLLAAACLLYGGAAWGDALVAAAVLVAATIVHVSGEMYEVAGEWGLGFALAPEHAHGQYQGMLATGHAVSSVASPLLMTALVQAGQVGWVVLAVVFTAAGLAFPSTVRWAAGRQAGTSGVGRVMRSV